MSFSAGKNYQFGSLLLPVDETQLRNREKWPKLITGKDNILSPPPPARLIETNDVVGRLLTKTSTPLRYSGYHKTRLARAAAHFICSIVS
ncbi:hypothetical protein EVAR_33571_1 [Eumeta japonica]|uniref:Uncharacterized protein n=1 Tax=Eumeta variegata TaxID=151549 RepID=A0A4C1VJQ8_EUMVA|nr:hypothetical protein EVAR_33571_1 [Eumeta japonica]